MASVRNVLFVMCDQLRRDHLSCYAGRVHTPNLDRLAKLGVTFDHAYVQSGVCGPSRMSYYTGRFMSSHGATWNDVALPVGQRTLGDYLASTGREAVLLGKSHVVPDRRGMAGLRIDVNSERGATLAQGGFTVLERYDGHLPPPRDSGYAKYLRERGYRSDDPWSDYVIAADAGGKIVSGWSMRNVHLPARVREEDSETAYLTDRAIDWIAGQGETPWTLHLSYVKPHWPYMAPAPYHALYRDRDTGRIVRSAQDGSADEHPVVAAYRKHDESLSFGDEAIARHVRPAYMGLVAQFDHHLGRLLDVLHGQGRLSDTLIVFTSDHGDFLGDRGLGEKELFYDEIVRVPLIVMDPDARADASRGRHDAAFVQAIDVLPTMLDALGIGGSDRIEGRSLLPCVRGESGNRADEAVFCELDYAFRRARTVLGRDPSQCRGFMVRTAEWKYVHWSGFRPQLFDLAADPLELHDRGADTRYSDRANALRERLFDWMSTLRHRVTMEDAEVARRTDGHRAHGIHIGIW